MTRPYLVALDDQVAAVVRDLGPVETPAVFLSVWGPCNGFPHGGCQHVVSYSQVYGSLGRLLLAGQVRAERFGQVGRRRATLWRWAGRREPMPPWTTTTEEERWEPS